MANEVSEKVDTSRHKAVNVNVKVEQVDPDPKPAEGKDEDRSFFFETKGPNPRPDGVYLDDEMRRDAEARRAQLENRKPDFDSPPAIASTPLVQEGQLDGGYAKRGADVTLPVHVTTEDGGEPVTDKVMPQPTNRATGRDDGKVPEAKFTTEAPAPLSNTKQSDAQPGSDKVDKEAAKSDNSGSSSDSGSSGSSSKSGSSDHPAAKRAATSAGSKPTEAKNR